MHKKHLIMALFAVVAAVAGYGVYQTQANEVALSEVALANAEALATGENDTSTAYCCTNYGVCMTVFDENGRTHIIAGIKFYLPC